MSAILDAINAMVLDEKRWIITDGGGVCRMPVPALHLNGVAYWTRSGWWECRWLENSWGARPRSAALLSVQRAHAIWCLRQRSAAFLRKRMAYRVSELLDGRYVRWDSGRERTLEIFNVDVQEQKQLMRRFRILRKDVEEVAGGPVVIIFHTKAASKKLVLEP